MIKIYCMLMTRFMIKIYCMLMIRFMIKIYCVDERKMKEDNLLYVDDKIYDER
jgi:hypothetical protein